AVGTANRAETLGRDVEEAEGEPGSEVNVSGETLEAELQLEGEELPEHGHIANLLCRSVLRLACEAQEVDIFEAGIDRVKAVPWTGLGIDADLVQAAHQMRGDNMEGRFQGAQLVVGGGHLGPDLSAQGIERFGGSAFDEKLAVGNDCHAGAEFAHVVDDVSGEDHGDVGADRAEQVEKPVALRGVETCRGLIDDNQ